MQRQTVLTLIWQSSPPWAIFRIFLILGQGILPLLSLYLTKRIVDELSLWLLAKNWTVNLAQFTPLFGLAIAILFANLAFSSLAEFVNEAQSQRLSDHMASIVHAKSMEIDLEYYESPKYYDILQRAQREVSYRPNQILQNLTQLGQHSIALTTQLGLLFSLQGWIIVVLTVAVLPSILLRLKFTKILYRWQQHWTSVERQAWYCGWMLTGDQFAKEIRLFNLGPFFNHRFQSIRQQIYVAFLKLTTQRALANFGAQAIAILCLLGVYGYVLIHAKSKGLTLGDLAVFHQALQQSKSALQEALSSLSALYEDKIFLLNLYEFLNLKPKLQEAKHPQPVPQSLQSGITFDQVCFQYTDTPRQALQDITLTIHPGEVIALVGENGSGKTTLIKLLCRLYDPTSGRITLDGVDLRQFSTLDLRQSISVIFQDFIKYNLSAQENIWLGNIQLPLTHERVLDSARRSGADEVIQSLPLGYRTPLGKWFDDGEELSIGQWQKVALARAFMKMSPILVLDEPTSAMDPRAEYEVFKTFRELIQGQTAILITHRLSTVQMADRIYLMEKGRIVEQGTHAELMQLGDRYASLFEIQAQYYR